MGGVARWDVPDPLEVDGTGAEAAGCDAGTGPTMIGMMTDAGIGGMPEGGMEDDILGEAAAAAASGGGGGDAA